MCATPRIVDRQIDVFFNTNRGDVAITWVASLNTGRRLWASCAVHGRVLPKHAMNRGLAWPLCSVCEAHAPMIAIDVRKPAAGKAGKVCGGACLSGQRSCDCRCNGRCHGAGRCYCA